MEKPPASPRLASPEPRRRRFTCGKSRTDSGVKRAAWRHHFTTLADVFDSKSNSIGFLRWLMALLVVFAHAGPLAGYYGYQDPAAANLPSMNGLGGFAVAGFFFFSGFLITKSRMGKSSFLRYFWRRALRIFPAFWAALLLTVGFIAPLSYCANYGTWRDYWTHPVESPLTYFLGNMFLTRTQKNIAEMGAGFSLREITGISDWNGSSWTLPYEFMCYLIVGVVGLIGLRRNRRIAALICATGIVLNALMWAGMPLARAVPALDNTSILALSAPFAYGGIMALYPERIPVNRYLAVLAGAVGVLTFVFGGWYTFGYIATSYFLMWLALYLPLYNWERFGDFSYGVYILAFPLMMCATYFRLPEHVNWLGYHVIIIVGVHVLAFASWHLIEKPAMSLKSWTPKWLKRLLGANRDEMALLRQSAAGGVRDITLHETGLRRRLRFVPLVALLVASFAAMVGGLIYHF